MTGARETRRGVDVRRRPEDEKEGESLMGAQLWQVLRLPAGPGIPTALPCSPTRGGQRGTAGYQGLQDKQDSGHNTLKNPQRETRGSGGREERNEERSKR